ncbi:MAG: ABC transporter six-transmembrane domain-containing protein [Ignavibacteriota bacterium]|nr:ABC transporter six-transmembrane domain-containing protein [Ignavibacteriota bacterium]
MLLIKHYKRLIIFALMLVVIEDVAWIVEPYIFGKVIDAVIDVQVFEKKSNIINNPNVTEQDKIKRLQDEDLIPDSLANEPETQSHIWDSLKISIKENPENTILFPLVLWIIAFAINSGVGAFRRSIDPKIFLRIYTRIATSISRTSILKKISISRTTARVELSQQFISFLEYRVPEIIQNAISISGAVIALYFFDWIISLTCLLIVLPMYIINKLYMKKVSALQKEYHDNYEEIYDVFSKRDPVHVRNYYNNLAKPQKKIANWGSFNFAFMRFTLLIIFLVVLYVAIELDNFSAGELYSIVAYLWTFVTATEYMPELLENWSSMKDIARRLKEEN